MAEHREDNLIRKNVSIFETLGHAGEKFFENREKLTNIRRKCSEIFETYKKKFTSIPNHLDESKSVKDVLFSPLQIRDAPEISQEPRKSCSKEEFQLIKDACRNSGSENVDRDAQHIKYSLGFLADGYASKYKKPCVAVVGQTKAGKSSLINSILQDKVVPQKVMRQTARVTYVTHCPIKFVAHMRQEKLIKIDVGIDVREEDVDLKFQDRNKKHEVNIEIRIGTSNTIVQNGFDIVDSPGLNENPALNDLCATMERSLLPLLIYVIEGRNGLTQTDIDDIQQIKSVTPQLKIIYFVTKLDRSKYDRLMYMDKKKKKGYADDKDMPGESDLEVTKRRLTKVLNKLKRNAFVPPSTEIGNSKDFHGADIWIVNEMRIHNPNGNKKENDEYNMKLMANFEESLMVYLKDRLESPLKEEVQYIISSLEKVLEKSTSAASEIAGERQEKLKSLELFEQNERELYEKELQYIKSSLEKEIDKMIMENRSRFVEMVNDPELGKTNIDSKRYKKDSHNANVEFRREIKHLIEKCLNEEIKAFITKFMTDKEERLRKKLLMLVEKLTTGKFGYSSFEMMLKHRLFYEYEFFEECDMSHSAEFSYNSKSKKRIDAYVRQFENLACGLFKSSVSDEKDYDNRSNPENSQWRREVAERVLNDFDKRKFLENVCDAVTKEFNERHNKFAGELCEQGTFLKKDLNISSKEKQCVREFAEYLAVQYAITFDIKTPLYVMINPLKEVRDLAGGGQARVKTAFIINNENPIVIKEYLKTFSDFKESLRLRQISMEIYYSSRLDHPRVLKLLGIRFEKTGEGWQFSAYYPYLKMGSVKNYLHENTVDLKTRIKLSVEIAEGIQHLHKLQIVHRDINLQNILVKEDSSSVQAVICDYGLTKSFGFIERSDRIGTTLYIAPELFNKRNLEKDSYTCSIDVFSFGISLWQLISFRLLAEYANFTPKFALQCDSDGGTIEKEVIDGARPELTDRKAIPPSLAYLMKRCWDGEPTKRPSFYRTMKEISIDCDDDPFKNQTILDELKKIQKELTT